MLYKTFLQGVSIAASPVLATIEITQKLSYSDVHHVYDRDVRPSVCLSVRPSHAGTE